MSNAAQFQNVCAEVCAGNVKLSVVLGLRQLVCDNPPHPHPFGFRSSCNGCLYSFRLFPRVLCPRLNVRIPYRSNNEHYTPWLNIWLATKLFACTVCVPCGVIFLGGDILLQTRRKPQRQNPDAARANLKMAQTLAPYLFEPFYNAGECFPLII